MIIRLLVYLIPLIGIGSLIGWGAWKKLLLPSVEKHVLKRLASERSKLICNACLEYVDPSDKNTIFDHDKWWHKKCYQKLLT